MAKVWAVWARRRGPVGGEEHQGGQDHHPREDPDLEQGGGGQVEGDQHGEGPGAGAPPQQPADDGAVEERPPPGGQVGDGGLVQQRADQREVGPVGQPDAQGLGLEQPVGVELGQPGEPVDDRDLGPQRPHRASRDRRRGRHPAPGRVQRPAMPDRQQPHQHPGQGDEPVVVEVQRRLDQLGVGEPDHEQGRGQAVAVTDGDAQAEAGQGGHVEVHPRGGQGADPLEPGVGEMVGRFEVEGVDPAPGQEADRAEGDQQAVGDPEDCGRVGRHRPGRGSRQPPDEGPVRRGRDGSGPGYGGGGALRRRCLRRHR